ncbi:MAG: flavodoxin [Eubacterium sp.]|nr:flavodoxin [Eubacterium sp.]
MAILTAFFSMKGETIAPGMKIVNLEKGHTAVVAETIQAAVGGELFEIETVKTYNPDHMKMIYEAQDELKQGIRPELRDYPDSLDAYDTVFLCYPNWWNTLPMPVLGFIERYDWTGKRIIPVNTSEGSGAGRSVEKIREVCTGAHVEAPYELIGSQVDGKLDEISSWAKSAI